MAMKRALCVGINAYPIPGADLRGCVNDANAWAELLKGTFGFPKQYVQMLLDSEATKANILDPLRSMLMMAESGDILVFTNSSHGSYVPDTNGDEPEYDEVLCPYDIEDNAIIDDELYDLFQEHLKDGVRLTVILDNCHSGTGTRLAGDDKRTERFLDPRRWGQEIPENFDFRLAKPRESQQRPESAMKEVLLAGCKDIEVSWDALIGGKFHGAMTQAAIEAIRGANGRLTYRQLHEQVTRKVEANGFDQHPQLEGSDENKGRLLFT
ncbi:MAG: caspase family protein [Planctomycetaceae bacterium]